MESGQVHPHETLFVTSRKRFVPVYRPGPGREGANELILYYGLQEVSFDEPELFPWAEKLIAQDSFLAGAAVGWSAEPLEWQRVRDLLDALLEAGLLDREPPPKSPERSALHEEFLEAERSRKAPEQPIFWAPDPGAALGCELPLGYLEVVVPVHRVAHPALDREGRQVGEINAFPEQLRLKLPTEWKTCGYAGSRYRDELPMNMTALRSMIAHWRPVLRATLLFREEFLRRYPQYPDGRWRLGDLHLFASGILALPALQLVRGRRPVPNGELDPVLSSLFRVTDGVRMVCAHMLDLYERPMRHDHPIWPRDLTEAAERENQYVSDRGVCAGPQNMIDEFVATLMDGKSIGGELAGAWVSEIPLALDYALRGRQLYATTFTLWTRMCLAYARLREALEPGPVRDAVERDLEQIVPTRLHLPEQRDWAEAFYREMFERSQAGLRGARIPPLDLTPGPPLEGGLFGLSRAAAQPVVDYLRLERAALQTAAAIQREINLLLLREQPGSPLTGAQLAIFHALRKGTAGALPYLPANLSQVLGVPIVAPSGPERG